VKTFSLSSFSSLTSIHLIVTRITFISQFSYSFVIFLSCSACSPHSPPGPLLKTAITIRYLVTRIIVSNTKSTMAASTPLAIDRNIGSNTEPADERQCQPDMGDSFTKPLSHHINVVGGGAERDGKVQEPVEDTGPTCRQKVRKGGARLPHRNGCGKAGPPVEEDGAGSQTSEWDPGAVGAGRGTGSGGGGAGCCGRLGRRAGTTAVLAHALLHIIGRRGVGGRGALSFVSFLLSSSLGASTFSWDRPGRRAKGSLQRAATARTVDRKTGQNVRRHGLHRSNASMINQKRKPPRRQVTGTSGDSKAKSRSHHVNVNASGILRVLSAM